MRTLQRVVCPIRIAGAVEEVRKPTIDGGRRGADRGDADRAAALIKNADGTRTVL